MRERKEGIGGRKTKNLKDKRRKRIYNNNNSKLVLLHGWLVLIKGGVESNVLC